MQQLWGGRLGEGRGGRELWGEPDFGERSGDGKKGGATWILDLREENGLGFLTVFVGQAKIFRANSR